MGWYDMHQIINWGEKKRLCIGVYYTMGGYKNVLLIKLKIQKFLKL